MKTVPVIELTYGFLKIFLKINKFLPFFLNFCLIKVYLHQVTVQIICYPKASSFIKVIHFKSK